MAKLVIMDHPLVQHKINFIRRKETGTKDFRQTIGEIAMLITYEATRELQLEDTEIETPICKATVNSTINKIIFNPRKKYLIGICEIITTNIEINSMPNKP